MLVKLLTESIQTDPEYSTSLKDYSTWYGFLLHPATVAPPTNSIPHLESMSRDQLITAAVEAAGVPDPSVIANHHFMGCFQFRPWDDFASTSYLALPCLQDVSNTMKEIEATGLFCFSNPLLIDERGRTSVGVVALLFTKEYEHMWVYNVGGPLPFLCTTETVSVGEPFKRKYRKPFEFPING